MLIFFPEVLKIFSLSLVMYINLIAHVRIVLKHFKSAMHAVRSIIHSAHNSAAVGKVDTVQSGNSNVQ